MRNLKQGKEKNDMYLLQEILEWVMLIIKFIRKRPTQFVVVGLCLLSYQFCASEFREEQFQLNLDESRAILPLGVELPALNKLSCAASCLSYNPLCKSFAFNERSKQCRLGSWLISAPSPAVDPVDTIYSVGDFCNTAANFSVFFNGNFSVCLWANMEYMGYFQAKSQCREKGGHMYTPKNQDKYNVMEIVNPDESFWIGLTDLVENGVYVWEDDNSTIDEDWKTQKFYPGIPPQTDLGCVIFTYFHMLYELDCFADNAPSMCEYGRSN